MEDFSEEGSSQTIPFIMYVTAQTLATLGDIFFPPPPSASAITPF